jgi:predicted NAD/FAD-dependent oxidoreductase
MRIAIVGAGIAGLACARQLSRGAAEVVLFDKGTKPGGRLTSLSIDVMSWDVGAQSFDVHDPRFGRQVAIWQKAGWAGPWPEGPAGSLVGIPTMASLVARECSDLNVHFGALVQSVEKCQAGWELRGSHCGSEPFDAVVVAVPAEQAAALISLHDLDIAREAVAVRSMPCWTAMAAFAEPVSRRSNLLNGIGPLAAAIRSRSKPGRTSAECWVLQASTGWSFDHLEHDRGEVAELMLGLFAEECEGPFPSPVFLKAHRWRFALPIGAARSFNWNDSLKLGACGDWCAGPTIEDAWLSGYSLGQHILESADLNG